MITGLYSLFLIILSIFIINILRINNIQIGGGGGLAFQIQLS